MAGVAVGEAGGLDSWGFDPDDFASVVGPEAELSVGWLCSTGDTAEGVAVASVGVSVVVVVNSAVPGPVVGFGNPVVYVSSDDPASVPSVA